MDNQFPLPGPTNLTPLPPAHGASPVPSGSKPLPAPEEASPPPPGYRPPSAAEAPVVKPSLLKIILPIAGGLLLLGLIIFFISRLLAGGPSESRQVTPGQATTLTYWGLWEPVQVMKPLIDEFERQNPSIKIDYQLQAPQDYQDRLATALESNNPPDIVRLHTTWLPAFASNLLPSPANTISATEMSTNFYPIINRLLVVDTQVYGIPLAAEGLGLFINNTMFQQKSLQPPKTWEDLDSAARALKDVDALTGKINRAGVALGNTTNVDHWPDIVSLMLFQSGVNLYDPKGEELETTLRYYTQFVTKDHVWDDTLPSSVVAFANEKVAMIFAPTWRAREIKEINPTLAWRVVPVPQLPDSDVINWASVWFEGVPRNGKHPKEAWTFLNFLASAQAQQILFESAAKDREYPQPPAHKAVATIAQNNPVIAPFVNSLESARSFYTAGNTQDSATGLNARLIKYLEDAVNGITLGQDVAKTLETLNQGFRQVLNQYGISSTGRTGQ
ncbi:MAG: Extracellular solute-binding protein family 1 [Candidatus Collierbacteria bacterium GW2011_GWF2_44_15]|uniref:Extracellular solute-binding protein family 1 n=1 Tax=Candidatus Collierbacteria bacterium GW2011_GWF2_44_15 TaxID=1618404 RepID=A0A0G1JRK8_9BACT|nr:MAG: Extracellular solute-binding protein family 1 [Candidatus Collierbacteria bacterium GW2011_GWF2_44_15]